MRIRALPVLLFVTFMLALLMAPLTTADISTQVLQADDTRVSFDEETIVIYVFANNGSETFVVRPVVDFESDWQASIDPVYATLEPGAIAEFTLSVQGPKGFGDQTATFTTVFRFDPIGTGNTTVFIDIQSFDLVSTLSSEAGKILGFWDNPLPSPFDGVFATAMITFAIWLTGFLVVAGILKLVLPVLTRKTETPIDDMILDIVTGPVLWIVISYGFLTTLYSLGLPAVYLFWSNRLFQALLIVMVTYIIYKLFNDIILHYGEKIADKTESELDDVLLPLIKLVGRVLIIVVGTLIMFQFLGFDITVFLAGAGIIGLVIAFAAQDTLSNLFSGIHILLVRPFKKGDLIEIDKTKLCRVESIGLQSTHLYSVYENIEITVPNNMLTKGMSYTITRPDRMIKDKAVVGVAYGTDPQLVLDILIDIARNQENVLTEEDRSPFGRFYGFGDSSLDFGIHYWVNDIDNRGSTRHGIYLEIEKRLREAGIEIPFPQRVIHMTGDGKAPPTVK